jgi:hypothetical protein
MAGRPPLRIGAHGKITRTHLGAFRSGRVSGDDLAEYYVSTLAASAKPDHQLCEIWYRNPRPHPAGQPGPGSCK